jgi:hypothetical protein
MMGLARLVGKRHGASGDRPRRGKEPRLFTVFLGQNVAAHAFVESSPTGSRLAGRAENGVEHHSGEVF